jgi:MFS family permease
MAEQAKMSRGQVWAVMLAGGSILMITLGARQSTGLFLSSINTNTGLGIVTVSLAMAIAQLTWGVVQPIFGALADRYGSIKIVVVGALLLASGTALTPFMHSEFGLIMAIGLLSAAGAGAASFSILIGATAQHLPPERRAFAAGFINAGGSFGQFVYSKLAQILIETSGWVVAMVVIAASALLTIPLSWPLRRRRAVPEATDGGSAAAAVVVHPKSLREQLREASVNRNYWLLHAGFFTCGFHIAFLVTHLPGEVALCGLPVGVAATSLGLIGLFNIAGSLTAGTLGSRVRMKSILSWTYAARAAIILIFLAAPKTALTFYIFGGALGFTWLATIPPTAGLIGKFFGVRYLSTLFGLTILTHQIGAFFGAYLGGLAMQHFGNYDWMWYADIVLAIAAALINLPITEAAPLPRAQVA